MIVSAFLALSGDTSLEQVVDGARALESAGVAAVGLLDAADTGGGTSLFESTTLAARIATQTSTIGVVASNSSLYGFPYHTARRLATLDHLAGGRSGWLMRTGSSRYEATAYEWRSVAGRGEELHRSTEYAEIARELWASWEDGAQLPDKAAGNFKDDSRIHPINYRSTSFRVAGPLDVPPSPQRRPVLFAEITTWQEAIQLNSYVDVAILAATQAETVASLAEAVAAGTSPVLVLIAGAIDDAYPALPAAAALELAESVGADGVALFLAPSAVAAATEAVSGLGLSAPTAPGTLAAALGIESTFVLGGNAA